MKIKKMFSKYKNPLLLTLLVALVAAAILFSDGSKLQGYLNFTSEKNVPRIQKISSKPALINPKLSTYTYVIGDTEGVGMSVEIKKEPGIDADLQITLWNGNTKVKTYKQTNPGSGVFGGLTWDGKNDDGHQANPGNYTVTYSLIQNGAVVFEIGQGLKVMQPQTTLSLYQVSPKTYKLRDPNGLKIQATLSNYKGDGSIVEPDDVQIIIFNDNGQQVKIFQNFKLANGPLKAVWYGEDESSGLYAQPGNYNVQFYFRKGTQAKQVSAPMPITVVQTD